jgi:uncharacterized membrane protein
MPFCPSCGASVEGKFCAKCGSSISGGAPSAAPPPAASAPAASELAPNVVATLCYLPVLIPAIIFLVIAPYNKDRAIRFHALQSLFLQIVWVVASLALGILMPFGSWFYMSRLLNLAVIVVAVFMMWKTYQGQKIVLPVLGPLAEKQA